MPEFFVILAAVLSLIATTISIIVGYGTIKQRKADPDTKRWEDWDNWRRNTDERLLTIDGKLDNDNRRFKKVEKEAEDNREFQRIMLKSMKGIIAAAGPANEEMRRVSEEIDEFLIKR